MNVFSSFLKQHPLLIVIKILIIVSFCYASIWAIIRTIDYCEFFFGLECGYKNYIEILKVTSYYGYSVMLLVPFIGTLTNRKIGWILIQSYFYLFIINSFFIEKYENDLKLDILEYIISRLILMIPIFIILSLNIEKISLKTYTISKAKLLGYNILAFTIGAIILFVTLIHKYKLYT